MAAFSKKLKGLFKSRKFKYGSVATGLTVAFVAVVVMINVIFSLLADAYSWKLDMTSYDLYSLSDSTKQTVRSLVKNEKIKLTIMYKEDEYPEQFRETVKRFAALSENLDYSFIDIDVNPAAMSEYGEEYNIQEGSIVVESKERIRVIGFNDLYQSDSNTGALTYKTEECLAAAIKYVTKEEVPLVYFVTGHGESGYEALMNLIANNGADVEEVKLNQLTEFDPLARCMVICGPAVDYAQSEIRQLQDFLANDYNYEHNLFYFDNPENATLPNLNAFLADWGIRVEENIVLETDDYSASAYANPAETAPLYTIPSLTEEEVVGQKLTMDYACVVPNSSSITLLFDTKEITETAALLLTSDGSYAKKTTALNAGYEKAKGDKEGPFNLAVLSTRYKYLDNVPVYSHLFAAGSVEMLNEYYMTYNGNGAFLYDIYQMMIGEDEEEIVGKEAASTMMTLDTATVRWASIIFIGVIPGICLTIGLIVFIRRRYL